MVKLHRRSFSLISFLCPLIERLSFVQRDRRRQSRKRERERERESRSLIHARGLTVSSGPISSLISVCSSFLQLLPSWPAPQFQRPSRISLFVLARREFFSRWIFSFPSRRASLDSRLDFSLVSFRFNVVCYFTIQIRRGAFFLFSFFFFSFFFWL